MKHSSFTAPVPLTQLIFHYIGQNGEIMTARWVQADLKAYMDFYTDLVLEIEIRTAFGEIIIKRVHIEFQRNYVAGYK